MPAGELNTLPVPVPANVTVKGTFTVAELNVAVIEAAAFRVTLHVAVPEHAPDQPANAEPADALAASWTTAPELKLAVQTDPQLIPAGVLTTVPAPLPARDTASETFGAMLKAAVTEPFVLALIVTEQAPVPEHAPDHPAKTEPAAGVAASLTNVPDGKSELHV